MKLNIVLMAMSGVFGQELEERKRNPMNHLAKVLENAESMVKNFKKDFPKMNSPERIPQYRKAADNLTRKWNRYNHLNFVFINISF